MQFLTIPPEVFAQSARDLNYERQRYLSVVYFIQSGDNGPVKIGFSADLRQRLSNLQVACPERLHLRATLKGDKDLEKKIHAFFAKHHIRNEWFDGPPIIAALKSAGFLGRFGV